MGECFIWSYNRCSALLVAVHVCRHNQRGTLHAVSYIGCPYKMWHFFRSDMCMWKDHLKMWRPELKKSYLSVAASNVPSCINIILCMFAISTFGCINRAPKLGNEFKKMGPVSALACWWSELVCGNAWVGLGSLLRLCDGENKPSKEGEMKGRAVLWGWWMFGHVQRTAPSFRPSGAHC